MKKVLLTIIIVSGFFLLYLPHFNNPGTVRIVEDSIYTKTSPGYYPYPLHGDEWNVVALSVYTMETGNFPNVNPYTNTYHFNLQSGTHIFVSMIFKSTGLDILYYFQFLASVVGVLTALFLFLFVQTITKNDYSAFFSSMFYLSINSNINTLGHFFFVPSTFSFFIMMAFLYFYLKNYQLLAVLAFVISVLSYPMVSLLLLAVYLINEVIIKGKINYKVFVLPGLMALLSLLVLRERVINILEIVTFRHGWTEGFEHVFGLFDHVSPIVYLFGIIGIGYLIYKKQYFVLLLFLPIVSIFSYLLFDMSYFFPYQRALLYTFIALTITAGIGIGIAFEYFRKINYYVAVFLAFVLIGTSFIGYYDVPDQRFYIMHLAQTEDINALRYVKDHFGTGNTIMVEPLTTFASYPASKNQVIATPPSNLHSGNITEVTAFFTGNCQSKENIIRERNISVVVTRHRILCGFNEQILNGVYIYDTR